MKSALALLGGPSVLAKLLPAYNSIGPAEVEAVRRVAEKGCLSGFYGSPGPEYLGGPMVRQFEEAWAAMACRNFMSSASSGAAADSSANKART